MNPRSIKGQTERSIGEPKVTIPEEPPISISTDEPVRYQQMMLTWAKFWCMNPHKYVKCEDDDCGLCLDCILSEEHKIHEYELTAHEQKFMEERLSWINDDSPCECSHEHWRHMNIPEGDPFGQPDGECAVCDCEEFLSATNPASYPPQT